MKKPQMTTAVGIGGLSTAFTKFILLFNGMQLNEVFDKFGTISAPAFLTAAGGILLSLWAIRYDEDKG